MLDTILDSPLSQWLRHDTDATDHIVISVVFVWHGTLMVYYLQIVMIYLL